MPIEFACESCSRLLRVPDGSGGSQCECPSCNVLLVIPDQGAPPQPEPEALLEIPCPQCSFVLACEHELLGTKGQCKNCGSIFTISEDPSVQRSVDSEWIFNCPNCNQLFEGNEEMRGRNGKCHACGEVFRIQLKKATAPEPSARSKKKKPKKSKPLAQPAANIQIACSSCNGVMEVPADAAGQQTACPYCQQLLVIPNTQPTPQAIALPEPEVIVEPDILQTTEEQIPLPELAPEPRTTANNNAFGDLSTSPDSLELSSDDIIDLDDAQGR